MDGLTKQNKELREKIDKLKSSNTLLEKQKAEILKNDVSQAYRTLQRKFKSVNDEKEVVDSILKKTEAKTADLHRQVAQLQRRLNAVK